MENKAEWIDQEAEVRGNGKCNQMERNQREMEE